MSLGLRSSGHYWAVSDVSRQRVGLIFEGRNHNCTSTKPKTSQHDFMASKDVTRILLNKLADRTCLSEKGGKKRKY